MLPGFHAVQHAQLLLWRQIREMLQALPQLLLSFRGQAAECRILLQFALLFLWWQIFIAPQPVPGVASRLRANLLLAGRLLARWLLSWCLRPWCLLPWGLIGGGGMPLLGREASLRQAGRWSSYCQSQCGAGQPSRPIVPPSHFSRPFERFAVSSFPGQHNSRLTDSQPHLAANPDRRATRNPNTSRGSCPTPVDRSPRCLVLLFRQWKLRLLPWVCRSRCCA